ncbi:50S ribosomal protein L14e [Candidatus Woesearchaeota archaeon]|nr:50S ribosomal protein L14e [Candidatus Woesearchaeota archaeon]
MVLEIGRVCVKLAGRDAGLKCVIVKNLDNNYVLVDGQTRRRKVNKAHLEPLALTIKISEDASNTDVVKALSEKGIACEEKKASEKKATERPKRLKVKKTVKEAPKKKSAPKKKKGDEE